MPDTTTEIPKATIENFDISLGWSPVEDDDGFPNELPPKDKRFVLFGSFTISAKWAVGEKSLLRITGDRGVGLVCTDGAGDFNGEKSWQFTSPTLKLGNSFLPGLKSGGPLKLTVEIQVQTSEGHDTLVKDPATHLMVRKKFSTATFSKTVQVPKPPSAASGPVPVNPPLAPANEVGDG